MSKIICDICGTSYPETEEVCPICGCSKDVSAALLADELLEQEFNTAVDEPALAPERKEAPEFEDDGFFEEDDMFEDPDDDDDDDENEDDDDEDDEEHVSNAGLVIALVLVILALIAVSAFILVRYFLPNVVGPETTKPSIVETTEAPVETTELRIPCESLALTSGGEIVLEEEGTNWLINVMALPENTTDELVYTSSDEAVVTVNEQGKLTAVGEGSAVITITCGQQELKCTVTCAFTQETTVPETSVPDESTPEDTTPETEPQETEAPKPVTGVINAKILNIRANPDANAEVVGVYGGGQEVTILEQKEVNGVTWGRTDKGWISMDYVKLDD